jgi:hypothetical protein
MMLIGAGNLAVIFSDNISRYNPSSIAPGGRVAIVTGRIFEPVLIHDQ